MKEERKPSSNSLVKSENKSSSSNVRANFVRVSDLQKSGGSGIDYKNLFGHKKKTSSSSISSASSSSLEKKKSYRSATTSNTTSKSEKKKAPTKRKYKPRESEPPKKIEKGDKLKWTTRNGKKYVSYNGKKYSGKKGTVKYFSFSYSYVTAFQLYNEWKVLNEGISDTSDNEQSDEEYVPPKKKTKKESKEKKAEETKPKPLLKKKLVDTKPSNTIDKFFKKEVKPETIVLGSDDEIESFSSGDDLIDDWKENSCNEDDVQVVVEID